MQRETKYIVLDLSKEAILVGSDILKNGLTRHSVVFYVQVLTSLEKFRITTVSKEFNMDLIVNQGQTMTIQRDIGLTCLLPLSQ